MGWWSAGWRGGARDPEVVQDLTCYASSAKKALIGAKTWERFEDAKRLERNWKEDTTGVSNR